jgi:hypothetical protein
MGKCIERVRAQQRVARENSACQYELERMLWMSEQRAKNYAVFAAGGGALITVPPEETKKAGWWRGLLDWRF